MIKLNKRATIIFLFISLLLSGAYIYGVITKWNDIEIFSALMSFFISYGVAVIFSSTYNHNYKKRKGIMSSPVLTFALIIYGIIGFGNIINRLQYFGFQNEVLFYQIASLLIGIAVMVELVILHVKLIKRSDKRDKKMLKKAVLK